jgi:hypothetical protein
LCFEVLKKKSEYQGVLWVEKCVNKQWQAYVYIKRKTRYGGCFDTEQQAAMKVNLMCDKHKIPRKNPTIDIELDVVQQVIHPSSFFFLPDFGLIFMSRFYVEFFWLNFGIIFSKLNF